MKYKISIIVPVYNVQDYLAQCIDSILNQTFDEYELILVDDGSKDNSGKICDEYAKSNSSIIVIHKANGGLSSARNAGLDVAKGDYVGFVDSDDWINKEMFSLLLEHAYNYNSDIVACNFFIMNKNGQLNPYTSNAINMEFNKEEAAKEIFTNKILTFSACNKIYKRELFNNLRYSEEIILEDMDISYRIIDRTEKVSYLKEPLYYYRYNQNSILRKKFTLNRVDEFAVKEEMYNFYLYKYPEVSDLLYFNMFTTANSMYSFIKLYYKEKLQEFKYLINFDKKILIRLLINKELLLSDKAKIISFLVSPTFSIFLRQESYKIKKYVS